jgi:hypothetical protein
MKRLSRLAFAALLLPGPLPAGASQPPSCTKPAESAYVKLPLPAVECAESAGLDCGDAKLAAAGKAACAAAGSAYAKRLQRSLRPGWWAVPAAEAEACREQKEGGSPDEGAGEVIQGSERVRLLVLGGSCEGVGGMYNLMLAVRSDHGLAVKALKLNYYEQRQEAPFSLDVVRNGTDTLALLGVQSHDMHEASTTTSAFKIDLASGDVAPYPLYQDESGPGNTVESSEPTLNFDEDESAAQVRDGKLVDRFVQYDYIKDCEEDSCAAGEVASKRAYRWNGSAFVLDRSAAPKPAGRSALAAHRACLKAKFDAKTGTADCPGDYAENCESNNDLSFLNYKAGKLDGARDYAAKALEECKDDPKQLKAAQYNDRRARGNQAQR